MTNDSSRYGEILHNSQGRREYARTSTSAILHDHPWPAQSSSQPQPSDFADQDEQSWHSEVRRNFDDFVRDYFAREPPTSSVARLIQMPRAGPSTSQSPEPRISGRASTRMSRPSDSRNHQASLPPLDRISSCRQPHPNLYQQARSSTVEARSLAPRRRPDPCGPPADIQKPVQPRDEISYKVTRPYSRLNRGPTRYEVRQKNKVLRKGYNVSGASTAYRTSMRPQICRPETHGLPRPLTTAINTHGNGKRAQQRAKCSDHSACSANHHLAPSSQPSGCQRLSLRGSTQCGDGRQRCTCEYVEHKYSGNNQEDPSHFSPAQTSQDADVSTSRQEYYSEDSLRHPHNHAQPPMTTVKRKYVRRAKPGNADTVSQPAKPKRRFVRRIPPASSSEDEPETAAAAARLVHGDDGQALQPTDIETPLPRVKRKYVRRKGLPGGGALPHEASIGEDRPTQDVPQTESQADRHLPVEHETAATDVDGAVRKKRKYTRRQPAVSGPLQTMPNAESTDDAIGDASTSVQNDGIRVKRTYTRRQPPSSETYRDGSNPVDGGRIKRKYTRRKPVASARHALDQLDSTTTGASLIKPPLLLNFAVIPLCANRPKYPEVHSFISLHYRKTSPAQLDPSILPRAIDMYNRNFDSALALNTQCASTTAPHTTTTSALLRPTVRLSDLDTDSPPWISTAQVDTIRARQRGLDYPIDDDGMESPHSTSIVLDTAKQLSQPSFHKHCKLVRWQWYLREQRKKERTGEDGWWQQAVVSGKPPGERHIHQRTSFTAPLMLRRNLKRQ